MSILKEVVKILFVLAAWLLKGVSYFTFLLGSLALSSGLVEMFLQIKIWPSDSALWAIACFGAYLAFDQASKEFKERSKK